MAAGSRLLTDPVSPNVLAPLPGLNLDPNAINKVSNISDKIIDKVHYQPRIVVSVNR